MSEATIRDLQTRRAIRQFQSAAPSAELLDLVLKTGTYAPTGQGKQAPVIIAVQDPQLRAAADAGERRICQTGNRSLLWRTGDHSGPGRQYGRHLG